MNRADFQQLSQLRITEAKVLLDNGHYAGAYYLAGYAIECALKACIAKRTKQYAFPPDPKSITSIYTHDVEKLVGAAELAKQLHSDMAVDPVLARHWSLVKQWKESERYNTSISGPMARDLYTAITDSAHGVLSWLKKHW